MTDPFWTLDRIAAAMGDAFPAQRARTQWPRGATTLQGVSTDTRNITAGDLFVALAGERFDAHDFLSDAVAKGASALVVSRPERTAGLGVPVFAVPDTTAALGALARFRRRAWGKPLVAITGTNGKTSTKDLTRAALGAALDVHATTGNLNNRIGVPLTLLALRDEADIAVCEMGMSVPGEIATLRTIAEPDIAVVTSVAEGHLEGLGSVDGVMREKVSIFDGVGVGIVPAAQPEIAEAAKGRARRLVVAGLESGDLHADEWTVEEDGLGRLSVRGVVVRPPLRGFHNLRNTMLALAVAQECGVSLEQAAEGIATMPVPSMRLAWEKVGSATLINDAYNANPGSMRAALELLDSVGRGRQRVAVLGGMRELGAHAERLHAEIADRALRSSIEVVAGVGEMGDALRRAGRDDARVVAAPDIDELWQSLAPRLSRDAVILLKASRGVRLERLLPHLTAWANG
jgi:UDP-N-acetylmuramoyl-tripeptide--D-alanyl-D-alanine ligase